ncbi:hypothetical protein CCHR01_03090 [Colletotrichum chrysophilum]|uniref:Uncharacterized protein n=1 Tax=Colletotrichum chrysophilum TaxID=1836956 RepID=A0AAD9EMY5_9PEZI|nr:hypothetical protein CCHR01_03090 [Colletotrichum chrysophilum]
MQTPVAPGLGLPRHAPRIHGPTIAEFRLRSLPIFGRL